jgi:hypothetical protein
MWVNQAFRFELSPNATQRRALAQHIGIQPGPFPNGQGHQARGLFLPNTGLPLSAPGPSPPG